jgi:ABC-type polysaccharide/polyol phosphate transport system ATPase subunit
MNKWTLQQYLTDSSRPYSLIIRTSDDEALMQQCDKVILMHEGKIAAIGPYSKVKDTFCLQGIHKQ